MAWSNLHAHSEGSLLDGAGTPKQRAIQARKLKQNSLSLTDHGNLIMAPQHIRACNEEGIKPVVGIEAYFKVKRQKEAGIRKANHLILLAKNEAGWKNLIKIATEAHLSGFYYKPCVDWELLKKYGEHLICSSACISGYLPMLIQQNDDHAIDECIERHLDIFGDDYFLEIMPHDVPAQYIVNNALAKLSAKWEIPLVATADSHYPLREWNSTQDILLMIATGQNREQRKAKREAGEDVYGMSELPLHMFSEDEIYDMFIENHSKLGKNTILEAIEQAQRIADSIEPFEIDKSNKLPVAKNKKQSREVLLDWCNEGLDRIGKRNDSIYRDRMIHELNTIKELGVVDYFVIVGKAVRWAREQGIRISSGRGSASGSLVCYLVNITTIDPIAHGLLFERFLNPNRKGLPDIDLDFEDTRRDEVKEWLGQEYGEDHVCNIIALGTFGGKSSLKDVARVLNVPFDEVNVVTKTIPEAKDVGGAGNIPPLIDLRYSNSSIDEFANKYPEVWTHATRIEGHIARISTHAGGVVVTDKPITEYMPMMRGKTGIVTSWSDGASDPIISDYGFLKIDILSLDGLSRQGDVVALIKKRRGKDINLDDLEIARNPEAIDQKVMELFRRGQTLGIFQFGGSSGITNFLRHVKPDRFEDLIAVNALYRPGPLEGGDAFKYGDLKHGEIPIEYWHESVQPFLEKTYGIMVYQEQMQQIAQELGGFSPGESDDMRKATAKLYRMGRAEAKQFMAQYKDKWVQGCEQKGLTQKEADDIWDKMLAFGGYSFNKSHATSYALMAYQDAYLKCYFPLDFYAALLSHESELEPIIREAKTRDITVKNPDINTSQADFIITDEDLQYGLRSIKYVGDVNIKEIEKHRKDIHFESLDDFVQRVDKQKCNKRVVKYLIMAGAFDSLGARDDVSLNEKRKQEVEALGFALSGTGEANKYADIIEARIHTESEIDTYAEGKGVVIGGEISSVKHHTIKSGKNKGKTMGFANISYKENNYECTLFRDTYEKYKPLLFDGNIVMVRGKKGSQNKILVNLVIDIDRLSEEIKKAG